MMLDTNLLLLNAGAVNAVAGIATTTNVIDLGTAIKNVGVGEALYMIVTVTTTFTSGGAATVDFRAVTDAADPMATDGTATIVGATGPIGFASLIAGTRFVVPLQQMRPTAYERFLGLNIATAVATTTAGSVTVEFMSGVPDGWVAHADAVN